MQIDGKIMNQTKLYYVYTLSIENKVIYIGFSANPIMRYKQHYTVTTGATYYLRYLLHNNGEAAKMSIVFVSTDKRQVMDMEAYLIRYCFKGERVLCNFYSNQVNDKSISYKNYNCEINLRLRIYQDILIKEQKNITNLIASIGSKKITPFYNLIKFNKIIKKNILK